MKLALADHELHASGVLNQSRNNNYNDLEINFDVTNLVYGTIIVAVQYSDFKQVTLCPLYLISCRLGTIDSDW